MSQIQLSLSGRRRNSQAIHNCTICLEDNYNYGGLRDELNSDRMVVGIKVAALFECLQMDANLTLDKTMKAVRQKEAICEQQTVLH